MESSKGYQQVPLLTKFVVYYFVLKCIFYFRLVTFEDAWSAIKAGTTLEATSAEQLASNAPRNKFVVGK